MRAKIERANPASRSGQDLTLHIELGCAVLQAICPGRKTADVIAAACGCSRSYIYGIEKRALKKLRHRLRGLDIGF